MTHGGDSSNPVNFPRRLPADVRPRAMGVNPKCPAKATICAAASAAMFDERISASAAASRSSPIPKRLGHAVPFVGAVAAYHTSFRRDQRKAV
jgi:hypothetical protein